jgi:hypothetical protein
MNLFSNDSFVLLFDLSNWLESVNNIWTNKVDKYAKVVLKADLQPSISHPTHVGLYRAARA